MRKKNILKLTTILALIVVIVVGAVKTVIADVRCVKDQNTTTQEQQETEVARRRAEADIATIMKKNNGDTFVLFKNGNNAVISENKENIIFRLKKLDKYPYKLENLKELENLILSSYSYSDMATVKEVYKTNQYITQSGNNITTFNDGSLAVINQDEKIYEFIAGETSDFSIYCNSTAELQELIKTYIK